MTAGNGNCGKNYHQEKRRKMKMGEIRKGQQSGANKEWKKLFYFIKQSPANHFHGHDSKLVQQRTSYLFNSQFSRKL